MSDQTIIDIKHDTNIYLLGFLWADGYVSDDNISLEIIKNDMDDIKYLFKEIKHSYYERVRTKNGKPFGNRQARIRISHKDSVKFLIDHNYKLKSTIDPYKILSLIPENKQYIWWLGYFDGDGGFYCKSSSHSFTLWGGYNQDYSSVCNLFKKLNVKYTIKKYKRKCGNSSCVTIRKQEDIKKLGNYIYTNNRIGLKRKYNKYLECIASPKPLFFPRKSNVEGIHFSTWTGKWICRLTINKKRKVIGSFGTLDEAIQKLNECKSEVIQ
jgi:hypothetical protein